MTAHSVDPAATVEATSPQATIAHALWSGAAVAVIVVLVATVAVESVPHPRGLAYFSPLRYAILTPACIMVAIGSALAYRSLASRFSRPRRALAAVIGAMAALILIGMAVGGSLALAAAG